MTGQPLAFGPIPRPRHVTTWGVIVRRLVMGGAAFLMFAVVLAQGVHGQQPARYQQVTVRAGDTVWSIATDRYPGADPRQKVDEIIRLNGLRGPAIYQGEQLRVPGA